MRPSPPPSHRPQNVETLGLREWIAYRLAAARPTPTFDELADESGLSVQLWHQLWSTDPKYDLIGFKSPATHRGIAQVEALAAKDDWEVVEHIGNSLGYPVPRRCPAAHRALLGLTPQELRTVMGLAETLKATRDRPFLSTG